MMSKANQEGFNYAMKLTDSRDYRVIKLIESAAAHSNQQVVKEILWDAKKILERKRKSGDEV